MKFMSLTLIAVLAATSIPETADAGPWRDRFDRIEDRIDRSKTISTGRRTTVHWIGLKMSLIGARTGSTAAGMSGRRGSIGTSAVAGGVFGAITSNCMTFRVRFPVAPFRPCGSERFVPYHPHGLRALSQGRRKSALRSSRDR